MAETSERPPADRLDLFKDIFGFMPKWSDLLGLEKRIVNAQLIVLRNDYDCACQKLTDALNEQTDGTSARLVEQHAAALTLLYDKELTEKVLVEAVDVATDCGFRLLAEIYDPRRKVDPLAAIR